MAEPSEYRLHLPASAESVALARLFLATVLRTHHVDEAAVDDAKLAVSELATECVVNGPSDRFSVVVAPATELFRVEVGPLTLGEAADRSERVHLARALFPSMELDPVTHTAMYTIAAAES